MKLSWQTVVLLALETVTLAAEVLQLIPAVLVAAGGGALLPVLLTGLAVVSLKGFQVICLFQSRKAGWIVSILLWALEALVLIGGLFLLLSGQIPAIRLSLILRVAGFGYLLLCLPTRAYFGVGKAQAALDKRRQPPGARFARLSARLHNGAAPLNPDETAPTPQWDLWLDRRGQRDELAFAMTAEGADQDALLNGFASLPSAPQWLRDSQEAWALLDRAIAAAFANLSACAEFPRHVGGECAAEQSGLLAAVTLEQPQEGAPFHATAEFRRDWRTAP